MAKRPAEIMKGTLRVLVLKTLALEPRQSRIGRHRFRTVYQLEAPKLQSAGSALQADETLLEKGVYILAARPISINSAQTELPLGRRRGGAFRKAKQCRNGKFQHNVVRRGLPDGPNAKQGSRVRVLIISKRGVEPIPRFYTESPAPKRLPCMASNRILTLGTRPRI